VLISLKKPATMAIREEHYDYDHDYYACAYAL